MSWTFKRNAEGEYEAHDGERIRAVIIRHPKAQVPWGVHRIRLLPDDKYEVRDAGERFRTLGQAKDFCSNRPGIWG